ncbi:hypothetical protein ABT308_38860, partial [Saccharopolyspora kobensis]
MNGVLGRANPLVLVAVGLLALVASLGVRSLLTAVITTGVYVLALALMLPSRSGHPLRFATVVLGGVSVAYSTWLLGGGHLDVAATAGLRIAVLALPIEGFGPRGFRPQLENTLLRTGLDHADLVILG